MYSDSDAFSDSVITDKGNICEAMAMLRTGIALVEGRRPLDEGLRLLDWE
jgi:hypothetical protein